MKLTPHFVALKSEALAWRFTGDAADKKNTFDRLDMVYQYHGRASGMLLDTMTDNLPLSVWLYRDIRC